VGTTAENFSLCETSQGGLGPNGIEGVTTTPAGTFLVELARPITPGAATVITFNGEKTVLLSHPGNVNGDSTAGPLDVLFLIDVLNGTQTLPYGDYSGDINHTGGDLEPTPLDILELINLLNGASPNQAWNGTARPDPAPCLGGGGPGPNGPGGLNPNLLTKFSPKTQAKISSSSPFGLSPQLPTCTPAVLSLLPAFEEFYWENFDTGMKNSDIGPNPLTSMPSLDDLLEDLAELIAQTCVVGGGTSSLSIR
jgi:hypothetical protein